MVNYFNIMAFIKDFKESYYSIKVINDNWDFNLYYYFQNLGIKHDQDYSYYNYFLWLFC